MKSDHNSSHLPAKPAECLQYWSTPDAVTRDAITPNPAIRDCVDCGTPFFSRSSGNVVCVFCRAASTAEFDQGGL